VTAAKRETGPRAKGEAAHLPPPRDISVQARMLRGRAVTALRRLIAQIAQDAKRDRAKAGAIWRNMHRPTSIVMESRRRAALLKSFPDTLERTIAALRDDPRAKKHLKLYCDAHSYGQILYKWAVNHWKEIPSTLRGGRLRPSDRRSPRRRGYFDVAADRLNAGEVNELYLRRTDWNGRSVRQFIEKNMHLEQASPFSNTLHSV